MFCRARLGTNRVIEHQPIGTALAFDSEKGRLWVICPRCVGWNLVPLEERWEAVEECEAIFARVPRHFSSENIGLAIAGDGTRLIRIGRPTRGEFAAWRYEPRLKRRRRINQVRSVVGSAAVLSVATFWGSLAAITASVGVALYGTVVLGYWVAGDRDAVFASVPIAERTVRLQRADARHIRLLLHEGERGVLLDERRGDTALGPEVPLALGLVLPYVNRRGGRAGDVADAVAAIQRAGGPEPWLDKTFADQPVLRQLPPPVRLGLEIASHEQMEADALRGELRGLELAWQAAEELASISDRLLTPDVHLLRRSRGDLTPGRKRT